MSETRISPYCRIMRADHEHVSVEAREHPYGSWLTINGDMFLSAIAIRELAEYAGNHPERDVVFVAEFDVGSD